MQLWCDSWSEKRSGSLVHETAKGGKNETILMHS